MQAIITKYLCPTNHRGSRIKASCQAGSLTIPWDNGLDIDGNHDAACASLLTALGWPAGRWVGGGLPGGSGNAYVRVP